MKMHIILHKQCTLRTPGHRLNKNGIKSYVLEIQFQEGSLFYAKMTNSQIIIRPSGLAHLKVLQHLRETLDKKVAETKKFLGFNFRGSMLCQKYQIQHFQRLPNFLMTSFLDACLVQSGNTKGGSITVPLTTCLTGLDWSVLQIKTKIVSCHTADSKPVKQEVNGTVILLP